jgi:hypothetical protein
MQTMANNIKTINTKEKETSKYLKLYFSLDIHQKEISNS